MGPALVLLVSLGVMAAMVLRLAAPPFWVFVVAMYVYAAAGARWSLVSARGASPFITRVLLIWAPAVLPIAWLVWIANSDDTEGMGMGLVLDAPPSLMVVVAALVATGMAGGWGRKKDE